MNKKSLASYLILTTIFALLPSGVFAAAVQNTNPTGDQSPTLSGNVEVGELVWVNNVLVVRSRANGTGTVRPLTLTTGSNAGLEIRTNGTIVLNGVQMSGDATTRILNNIVKYTESGEALVGALVIQTTIPQDSSTMFSMDIDLYGRYQDASSIIKITTGGYLTPESNGGFRGWHTNLSSVKPRLRYMRNVSTGNTAIVIGDVGSTWNYPKMMVGRLLGGLSWSDTYAAGWTVLRTADLSGYTNSDDISEVTTAVNSTGVMTGSISASQVSGGAIFGSTAGKGNYTFQAAANTNSVLFVDAANERVGVGTNSPSTTFDVRNGHLYVGSETFSNPGSWASTINLDGSSHARILIEERSTGVQTALWSHTGGNAKVGTVSSHNFGIITAGTERITINTSGNVGIGTTDFSYTASDNTGVVQGNPTNNRVFVSGSIQLLANNDAIVFGRGTGTFLKDEELGFGWGGGFYMNDGTNLRIRGDKTLYSAGSAYFGGNVGIGTASPGSKLSVTNGGANKPTVGLVDITSASGLAYLTIGNGDTANNHAYIAGASSLLEFGSVTDANSPTAFGRWTGTGLGVGTTNPGQKLDVVGIGKFTTTNDYQLLLTSSDTWTGISFDDVGTVNDYIWYNGGAGTFSIGGGGSNVTNKKLHVNGGMTVGSGYGGTAVSPNSLVVEGSVTATGGFSGAMAGSLGAAYITPGSFGSTSGKGNYVFEAAANTNNVLKVDASNERVGIGTASPTQKLDVSGDVLAVNHRVVAANGNGLCFWSDCTNYKVHMGVGTEYQYGPVTDYSIKTTMDAGAGRGFTWGRSGIAPIAAMNAYTGNFQTAGTMTATQFIGGGASITGVNADTLDTFHASALQFSQSNRDFVNGTLIQSNIDYSQTSGEPFLLEIEGNSYGSLIPFDIKVQGYIYSDTIINAAGIANGTSLSGLVAFNYNGKLCFWFPRQAYWQGFSVFINDSYSGVKENRLVSISDSIKPAGVTKEYTFTIYQSIHSGNLGSQTINATKVTPGLFGGGNFGFDTNTLYIDATNHRVGVGTATPGYPLQVGGSTNRSTPSLVVGDYGTINMIPYSTTHTYASLYTGNAEDLRMTAGTDSSQLVLKANNGNVGVGTTGPAAKFHTQLDTNNVDIIRASTAAHSIGLGVDSNATYWGASIFQDGTKRFTVESNGGILVGGTYQASDAPANGAIIEGNVGIGTTSPQNKTHIVDVSRSEFFGTDSAYPSSNLVLQGTESARTVGTGPSLTFAFPANTDGTNVWAQARIMGTPDNANSGNAVGRLYLQVRDNYNPGVGGSWNWRTGIMIAGSGNVGIGTTSPGTYKLYVAGGAKFDSPIEVGSPTATNHATTKSYVDSVLGTGGSGTSTASFGTIYVTGTTTLAATAGKVIIGGAGPSLKLDVTGQGQLTDTISATKYYDYNDPTYYVDPANTGTALKFNGAMQAEGTGVNYLMGQLGVGASNPGTHRFYVGNGTSYFNNSVSINGTLTMVGTNGITLSGGNIGSVGKLTVTTIDPLYEIDGEKYATFASSIAGGVKEEFVGRGTLSRTYPVESIKYENKDTKYDIQDTNYSYTIDFTKVERGSDLWVWYQAVDFDKKNVEALVTAYGSLAKIGYKIDGKKLIFFGDEETEFSFRLVGNRHDWKEWPTYSKDQKETPSFILKAK